MGSANQPYVNFFFIKKFQSLISGLAGNADPHLGMRQDIGLQPGKKNISAERGTGSDTELRNVSGTVMKDGTFSFIDKLKGCLYFSKRIFPSGVRATPLEFLLKSKVLRLCSSFCTARLTAGWLMYSSFAALEILPVFPVT